jgi:hypothetical protein
MTAPLVTACSIDGCILVDCPDCGDTMRLGEYWRELIVHEGGDVPGCPDCEGDQWADNHVDVKPDPLEELATGGSKIDVAALPTKAEAREATTGDDSTGPYRPAVGEIVAFGGLEWTPRVVIVECREERAAFATIGPVDDEYATLTDEHLAALSTADTADARRDVAAEIQADNDVEILTAPYRRFAPIGEDGIRGVEGGGSTGEGDGRLVTDGGVTTADTYGVYELRAVYARDHASGRTIEQLIECTAPTDASKETLKDIVADATGRMAHSIEELEIVASGEREHIEETAVFREGEIELGGRLVTDGGTLDLDDEWRYDAYRVGRATRTVEVYGEDGFETIEEGTIRFEELDAEDQWLWNEDSWMAHYVIPEDKADGDERQLVHQPFEKLGILEFPHPMTEDEAWAWLREVPERWRLFCDERLESDLTAVEFLDGEIR